MTLRTGSERESGHGGPGTRPLHVVVTVNAAWNLWNFRRQLLAALLADGHRVTVLAPADDTTRHMVAMGCEAVDLRMDGKGLNPLSEALLLLRFVRIFRATRPDVVLGFTIKNNLFGSLAARMLGVPFIPNVTGLGTAFLSGRALQRLARALYRLCFRSCPRVFFQNRDDLAKFVGEGMVTPAQAELLPGSGIDLAHFAACPPARGEPVRFLMIARLLRDKGVLEYVEAARILSREGRAARFELLGAAGSANRSAFSAGQAREWEQTHGIAYLGSCDDVRPAIAGADCVVLPSYREGAPRTLIEAAAMARPLIATDVPGCRAVVDDGANGFLCAARSAESLAAAMRRFLALAQPAREAMGEEGRRKMEAEYDVALVIAAYRKAIASLPGPAGRFD